MCHFIVKIVPCNSIYFVSFDFVTKSITSTGFELQVAHNSHFRNALLLHVYYTQWQHKLGSFACLFFLNTSSKKYFLAVLCKDFFHCLDKKLHRY